MGNFYANFCVRTEDAGEVAKFLADVADEGVVLPVQHGRALLSSRDLETMDGEIRDRYGARLSQGGTPVFFAANQDDDMLLVILYRDGACVAWADTNPGAWSGEDEPPKIEGADRLAGIGDGVDPADLAVLLTDEQVFAVDTHKALVRLLGLPDLSAGFGYRYWKDGEFGGDGHHEFGRG